MEIPLRPVTDQQQATAWRAPTRIRWKPPRAHEEKGAKVSRKLLKELRRHAGTSIAWDLLVPVARPEPSFMQLDLVFDEQ